MLLRVIIATRTNSSDSMEKEESDEDDSKKGRKWPTALKSSLVSFVYK